MRRANSLEKTLMLGKIEGRRRREWQRMRWLERITNSVDMNLSKLWEMVKDREAWYATVHRVAKSQTWLSDWTTTTEPTLHSWRAHGLWNLHTITREAYAEEPASCNKRSHTLQLRPDAAKKINIYIFLKYLFIKFFLCVLLDFHDLLITSSRI